MAIDFLFQPRCSSLPSLSLARFFFYPPTAPIELSQVSTKLITPQLPFQLPLTAPSPFHLSNTRFQVQRKLSSYTLTRILVPILVGTAWSRKEPTVRRSAPTHPRSWQAPLPCPGRARRRYALCPFYTLHTLLLELISLHESYSAFLNTPTSEIAER